MKSVVFSGAATMALLMLLGCMGPVSAKGENPSTPSSLGSISVQVNPNVGAKGLGLFDVTQAEANSDWYEVIAYNATNVYSVSSGKGTVGVNPYSGGVTIGSVAPGDYNVIALAGRCTNEFGHEVVLLGSGEAQVTVGSTGTVPVAIVLTNALWKISGGVDGIDKSAYGLNVPFDVYYKYASGVNVVRPRSGVGNETGAWQSVNTGSGATDYPGFTATNTYSPSGFGVVEPTWSYSVGFGSALATAGTFRFSLATPYLELNDTARGRAAVPLVDLTATVWELPNDLNGNFETLTGIPSAAQITFQAPDIGPTVTWGPGR